MPAPFAVKREKAFKLRDEQSVGNAHRFKLSTRLNHRTAKFTPHARLFNTPKWHRRVAVHASAHRQRRDGSGEPFDKTIVNRAVHIEARCRSTHLAIVQQTTEDRALDGFSTSASARMIIGFLAPSSRANRVIFSMQATPTLLPTRVEPVNDTLLTCGRLVNLPPTEAPPPVTTLNTPAGIPAAPYSVACRGWFRRLCCWYSARRCGSTCCSTTRRCSRIPTPRCFP